MAKLGQNVADTSFAPPAVPNGVHTFEIRKVEDKEFGSGAAGVTFQLRVAASEENQDAIGRTFSYTIILVKKDGGYNEPGGRELKNLIKAVLGEDAANDPDTDTEQLDGQRFVADLKSTPSETSDLPNYRLSKYMSV